MNKLDSQCAWCKRYRGLFGLYFHGPRLSRLREASHGICPACAAKVLAELKGGEE